MSACLQGVFVSAYLPQQEGQIDKAQISVAVLTGGHCGQRMPH